MITTHFVNSRTYTWGDIAECIRLLRIGVSDMVRRVVKKDAVARLADDPANIGR